MKFPILASVILFIFLLTYEISKNGKTAESQWTDYWNREAKANGVRRKPLDTLDYIIIPLKELPIQTMCEDKTIKDCTAYLTELAEAKIVNFTGISNTDLKLRYGAPNIKLLMEYDQNYTFLVRTLQKWADRLYELSCTTEAKEVLEFAVSTKTDIRATYILLAKIYQKENTPEKIGMLLQTAETLQSAMKPSIVRALQEFYQCNGLPDSL